MPHNPIRPQYVADTLPPELLAAIGEIVVRWGRLEWQLSNLLSVGFDLPKDTGRALLIGAEINVLCGTARTLTHTDRWIKDENLRKDIRKLVEEIRDKAADRNNYAHGVFGFDMETPNSFARYLFHSKEHRVSPSQEKLALEELQRLAEEARSLVDRTVDLTVRIKASIERARESSV